MNNVQKLKVTGGENSFRRKWGTYLNAFSGAYEALHSSLPIFSDMQRELSSKLKLTP